MLSEQANAAPQLVRTRQARQLGFSRLPLDLAYLDSEWLQSYNEVILDAEEWSQTLPFVIEAVFKLNGSSTKDQEYATNVHELLVSRHWHRNGTNVTALPIPLLIYDPMMDPPFSVAISQAHPDLSPPI